MLTPDDRERIRRSYYLDKKNVRQIATDEGRSRETIRRAISNTAPKSYQLKAARPAPLFQPFQSRVEELLAQDELTSTLHSFELRFLCGERMLRYLVYDLIAWNMIQSR